MDPVLVEDMGGIWQDSLPFVAEFGMFEAVKSCLAPQQFSVLASKWFKMI